MEERRKTLPGRRNDMYEMASDDIIPILKMRKISSEVSELSKVT